MAKGDKSAAKASPAKASTRTEKAKVAKTAAPKKASSPYNQFMARELPKFKAANPDVNHKDAFKKVAALWATHTDNPKNQK